MKPSQEFVVGKHGIGYVDSDFLSRMGDQEFKEKTLPTFQKLTRSMDDAEIESELKPGMCELGDVLAFLKNPPEGMKDGYANLFYTKSFVVGVGWGSFGGGWSVSAWGRGGFGWRADSRVFSPATGSMKLIPSDSLNFESLTLAIKKMNSVLKINIGGKEEELIRKSEVLEIISTSTTKAVKKNKKK